MSQIKVPVYASSYERHDGEIIHSLLDADGKEIARGVDSATAHALSAYTNAALESQALAETKARYEAALEYSKQMHEQTRKQLLDEIAMHRTELDSREKKIAELKEAMRLGQVDMFSEAT